MRRNRMQVVAERWGSLNSLTAGLTEQKAAHGELPARRRQSSQHAAHRNLPQTCSQAAELCSIVLACLSSAGTSAGCRLHACMHNTSIRAQAVLSDTVLLLHATAKAHMAAARERRQAAGGGEDQGQQRRPDAPGYLQVTDCVTPDGVQRG